MEYRGSAGDRRPLTLDGRPDEAAEPDADDGDAPRRVGLARRHRGDELTVHAESLVVAREREDEGGRGPAGRRRTAPQLQRPEGVADRGFARRRVAEVEDGRAPGRREPHELHDLPGVVPIPDARRSGGWEGEQKGERRENEQQRGAQAGCR